MSIFDKPQAQELTLYEYQHQNIDALREGFKQNKRQVFYSPCGAGKTEMSIFLMRLVDEKDRKVVFLCDRRILVMQTSARMDRYGIPHGIIMAGIERNYHRNIQVASMQTIEAMGSFPQADMFIYDECVTGDTEILTENGFVRFDCLEKGKKVAQFNSESNNISFVNPIRYIEHKFKGNLTRVFSDNLVDIPMTKGHDLLLKLSDGRIVKNTSEKVKFNQLKSMFVSGYAIGKDDNKLTPYERLMIALQADGYIVPERIDGTCSLQFQFSKDRKITEFLKIIEDGMFDCSEVLATKEKGNIKERRRFTVKLKCLASKDISTYFKISDISGSKAAEIIENMVMWDGSILKGNGRYYYSSVEEKNVDFYQAVALLAGYKTNKTIQVDYRSENHKDVFRLFIIKGVNIIGTQQIKKEDFYYDGIVYCVEVPDGNIILRRNGKPLITGNCHQMRKKIIDYIQSNNIRLLGLSGSPHTSGMGKVYSKVTGLTTMKQLVEDYKKLVPLRVFVCQEIDMQGAKKIGGEYSDKEVTERGVKITGCVVTEWHKKTKEIYGELRKTIVFCAGTAHGINLEENFQSAGFNFRAISYKNTEEYKAEVLAEFAKPDSKITGVISCEILVKGFDVPDVHVVVDARPLSKSFSSHVQKLGRGMRGYPGKEYCIYIDHAGNYLRFKDQWLQLYSDGVNELDDNSEQVKSEPSKEQKEAAKCPICNALWDHPGLTCTNCGHTRKLRNEILTVPGEMVEVETKAVKEKYTAADKARWYAELLGYCRRHSKPDSYALAMFKNKFDAWPYNKYSIHPTEPGTEVMNYVRSRNIAYAKRAKR